MSEPSTTTSDEPQAPQPGDPIIFVDALGLFRNARVLRVQGTTSRPGCPELDVALDGHLGPPLQSIRHGHDRGRWLRPSEAEASPVRFQTAQFNRERPPSERRLEAGAFVLAYVRQQRGPSPADAFITAYRARVRDFQGAGGSPRLEIFSTFPDGSLLDPPGRHDTSAWVVDAAGYGRGKIDHWAWPDEPVVADTRIPPPPDPADVCSSCKAALRGTGRPLYIGPLFQIPTPVPVARLCENCLGTVRDLALGVRPAEATA